MLHFGLAFPVPGLYFVFTLTEAVIQFQQPPIELALFELGLLPSRARVSLDQVPLFASGSVRIGITVADAVHPVPGGTVTGGCHLFIATGGGNVRHALLQQAVDLARRYPPLISAELSVDQSLGQAADLIRTQAQRLGRRTGSVVGFGHVTRPPWLSLADRQNFDKSWVKFR